MILNITKDYPIYGVIAPRINALFVLTNFLSVKVPDGAIGKRAK
jgi:hypothetical protein